MTVTKKLFLLSTCGTSLLTNGVSEDDRRWLTSHANDRSIQDTERLERLLKAKSAKLVRADVQTRRRMSAEINGIEAVKKRWPGEEMTHILLHTDTEIGEKTAELVREILARGGLQNAVRPSMLTAAGLRTADLLSFREAVADLTRQLIPMLQGFRDSGYRIVFNLTGGFKSVNGYLEALGMLYADHSVFLFERSAELMEIPRLPVRLAMLEALQQSLLVFRRLAVGYAVTQDDASSVPESLLTVMDGVVMRSVWGDVVWQENKPALFAGKLLDPLSQKVVLGGNLRKSYEKLELKRRTQVNEALDDLSAHFDDVQPMLKSHTFKPIQGKPVNGVSTHELYVWSDGDAGRLFGHYAKANGTFVVDDIGKHL